MEKHNLVPPSHFEVDSLESSPSTENQLQNLCDESPLSAASLADQRSKKVVLQTPDDFIVNPTLQGVVSDSAPRYEKFSFQHPNVPSKCHYSGDVKKESGVQPGLSDDLLGGNYTVIKMKMLKDENETLRKLLHTSQVVEKPLTQKSAASQIDIISHQVQFIERLKSDILQLTTTMQQREQELFESKLKSEEERQAKLFLEKDVEKLCENMQLDAEKCRNLEVCVADLQSTIERMKESNATVLKRHEDDIQLLHKQHIDNVKKLEENEEAVREAMKAAFNEEKLNWQEKISAVKQEYEEKVQTLSFEHHNEMQRLSVEIKSEQLKLTNETTKYEHVLREVQEREEKMKIQVDELTRELQNTSDNLKSAHSETDALSSDLNSEREAVAKLKTYIAKIQADDLARSQWEEKRKNIGIQMKSLEQDKEELLKKLELLTVRFNAVSKILEMQETAIAAHTKAISDPINQNKAGVVTQQWRSKVFELMVQCKSQEIINKEQLSKHQIDVNILKSQLEDQKRQCAILTSQVEDVDAQLQLRSYTCQALTEANHELKEQGQLLKSKLDEQESAFKDVVQFIRNISSSCEKSFETNFTKSMERCLRLEQRLAFANNRLRTVQDLLARRDTMWRMRLQKTYNGSAVVIPEKETQESPDLSSEVIRLTEERDMLSQRLAHDAASFERTTAELNQKISDLQMINSDQEKTMIRQEETVSELHVKIKNLENDLADMKADKEISFEELRKMKKDREKDIGAAVHECNLAHLKDTKQHEAKLSKVKRDLTKAVVSLRQAERSSTREKHRFNEQLELERQSWLKEEQKLKGIIRELQKDNNLIKTTLRQEGLIETYKAARAKPTVESETPPKHVHFAKDCTAAKCDDPTPNPDVEKLLQDLTNLSEKVLADSESD